MNSFITVLEIENVEHIKDVERDSPEAFWRVIVKCLEGATRTSKQKVIVVKEIGINFIKTGRYSLAKTKVGNLPLYEPI